MDVAREVRHLNHRHPAWQSDAKLLDAERFAAGERLVGDEVLRELPCLPAAAAHGTGDHLRHPLRVLGSHVVPAEPPAAPRTELAMHPVQHDALERHA